MARLTGLEPALTPITLYGVEDRYGTAVLQIQRNLLMTANTHHTKLKGDIAVAAVILDLTKKGYVDVKATPLMKQS